MDARLETLWTMVVCSLLAQSLGVNQSVYRVPDEQRLYRDLMWGYETSVRPVLNANHTVLVNFRLTLNQIIDLDERKQVLTTNVFIDQSWTDENLRWEPEDYNNIRTLRVHESQVWLPDTFLFNNADEGSTGFMRGMYVLLNANGTVLWPVPVKLKSSCKVNIAYFPFDDQRCQWRFGSWIYSGSWIDFHSSRDEVDLSNFIDNSEWELVSIAFQKSVQPLHTVSAVDVDAHPDLLFTLHIRRRTLFYIFNIIAPCVMLSVLTLLTFWLPTTSGEKISLGLSVFLAFSMFMLLIAEEVPATSNSVPLIGIYLTTVMTMTSVSVIMAVMVINLYNRGSKAVHAPRWLRVVVLEGLSRLLGLKHDMDKLTDNIKLDKDEEAKYACMAHPPVLSRRSRSRRLSRTPSPSPPVSPRTPMATAAEAVYSATQTNFRVKVTPQRRQRGEGCKGERETSGYSCHGIPGDSDTDCCAVSTPLLMKPQPREPHLNKNREKNGCRLNLNGSLGAMHGLDGMRSTTIPRITITGTEEEQEAKEEKRVGGEEAKVLDSPVWVKRSSVIRRQQKHEGKVEEESDRQKWRDTRRTGCYKYSGENCTDTLQNNSDIYSKKHVHNGKNAEVYTNASAFAAKLVAGDSSGSMPGTDGKPAPEHAPSGGAGATCGSQQQPKRPIPLKVADVLGTDETPCRKKAALLARRQIVVEWQTIATVIDRLLFWIFLVGTVAAYVVILFLVPYTKPGARGDASNDALLHALQRAKRHDLLITNTI